jgi:flavin reductase (DIM6/NTAB) family NADH-FMN oxidoreductase RutF
MDPNMKKTALRMIPYGLYVLTAESKAGAAAATVNWVTRRPSRRRWWRWG